MGCEWIGEHGKVEKHLDFDNDKGECQFAAVKRPLSKKWDNTFTQCPLLKHRSVACYHSCSLLP